MSGSGRLREAIEAAIGGRSRRSVACIATGGQESQSTPGVLSLGGRGRHDRRRCLDSAGSLLQHPKGGANRRRDPELARQVRETRQLWPWLREVAAQRAMGLVLAEAVAQAEGVDDGALPIGDPEPLATFLPDLDATEIERRRSEDVDRGRRMIDRRAVRPLRNGEVDLGRDVVGEVPVRQRRVQRDHPVRRPCTDSDEVDVPDAGGLGKLEQATRQLEDVALVAQVVEVPPETPAATASLDRKMGPISRSRSSA